MILFTTLVAKTATNPIVNMTEATAVAKFEIPGGKMKQDFLLYFMPINHSLYRNVILRTFDKLGNIDTHRYNLPFAELSTLELWFAARMPWLVLGASVFGTKIPSTKRVIIFLARL